jgi:hypothetical protein
MWKILTDVEAFLLSPKLKTYAGRSRGTDSRLFCLQSMIGHCLGAAGGLEAIATIKAIETGWLHPTINQFVRSDETLLA